MPRHRNRRPPTAAEREARRHADRERIEQAACALLTSDGWRRWIHVRASNGLNRYSLRNQLLIAIDCHHRGITPTYVAGFRSFLALNRCVRTGEKAIRILAPVPVKQHDSASEETGEKRLYFRTVRVFDTLSRDRRQRARPCRSTP
ncbi:MAG: ArdC family protein [Solirubrobacteraceae bacterium]